MRIVWIPTVGALTLAMSMVQGALGSAPQMLKGQLPKQFAKPAPPIRNSRYDILQIPIPNATFSLALDINERGVVAGIYETGTGDDFRQHTFVWYRNELQTITYPGATLTNVPAVNNSDVLFGNWGTLAEQTAGYYDLHSARWTPLPAVPGKPLNIGVRAIDSGNAVGLACEGDFYTLSNCQYWVWDGKSYQPLAIPGEMNVLYVNNRGQMVGYLVDPSTFAIRAFLWERGITTWLAPPGVNEYATIARSISNSGAIVMNGETTTAIYWRPFVYDAGAVAFLPDYAPGGQTSYGAMNSHGDLAGIFCSNYCFALVGYRK